MPEDEHIISLKQPRGIKRSSWNTFKRRLLLVRLVLHMPRSKHDLIDAVQVAMNEHGYPEAADSALKHDLQALKMDFGCEIQFSRLDKHYHLTTLGDLAILDLTEESLQALRFLEANFPAGDALPKHANIRTLLKELERLLPEHRQGQQISGSTINLERVFIADNRISPTLINKLNKAIGKREIGFDYQTNQSESKPIWHRVAPYKIIFGNNGHAYLVQP